MTLWKLHRQAWDWGGKTAFFWSGLCFICMIWIYFRLPETKGLTYREIDTVSAGSQCVGVFPLNSLLFSSHSALRPPCARPPVLFGWSRTYRRGTGPKLFNGSPWSRHSRQGADPPRGRQGRGGIFGEHLTGTVVYERRWYPTSPVLSVALISGRVEIKSTMERGLLDRLGICHRQQEVRTSYRFCLAGWKLERWHGSMDGKRHSSAASR
jgi:hypothetical protein